MLWVCTKCRLCVNSTFAAISPDPSCLCSLHLRLWIDGCRVLLKVEKGWHKLKKCAFTHITDILTDWRLLFLCSWVVCSSVESWFESVFLCVSLSWLQACSSGDGSTSIEFDLLCRARSTSRSRSTLFVSLPQHHHMSDWVSSTKIKKTTIRTRRTLDCVCVQVSLTELSTTCTEA